jgi:hypothetical protein
MRFVLGTTSLLFLIATAMSPNTAFAATIIPPRNCIAVFADATSGTSDGDPIAASGDSFSVPDVERALALIPTGSSAAFTGQSPNTRTEPASSVSAFNELDSLSVDPGPAPEFTGMIEMERPERVALLMTAFSSDVAALAPAILPEPVSLLLLGSGMFFLAWYKRQPKALLKKKGEMTCR